MPAGNITIRFSDGVRNAVTRKEVSPGTTVDAFCRDNGIDFKNVTVAVRDGDGNLKDTADGSSTLALQDGWSVSTFPAKAANA